MITGKNIVLTGGTSGIGKAVLDLLAVEKSNRIVVAARSAAKLTGYGENVFPFPCDISTREGVDSLFEAMEAQLGKADIFIANAGAPYYEVYDYTNWDRVDAIFRLNAMSPIYLYQVPSPPGWSGGYAGIYNFCHGRNGYPGLCPVYCNQVCHEGLPTGHSTGETQESEADLCLPGGNQDQLLQRRRWRHRCRPALPSAVRGSGGKGNDPCHRTG